MIIKYTSTMIKSKGMKTVECREHCGNKMEISNESVSGMCWRCVNKMMSGPLGALGYNYNENHTEDDDNVDENQDD